MWKAKIGKFEKSHNFIKSIFQVILRYTIKRVLKQVKGRKRYSYAKTSYIPWVLLIFIRWISFLSRYHYTLIWKKPPVRWLIIFWGSRNNNSVILSSRRCVYCTLYVRNVKAEYNTYTIRLVRRDVLVNQSLDISHSSV